MLRWIMISNTRSTAHQFSGSNFKFGYKKSSAKITAYETLELVRFFSWRCIFTDAVSSVLNPAGFITICTNLRVNMLHWHKVALRRCHGMQQLRLQASLTHGWVCNEPPSVPNECSYCRNCG